MPVDRADVVEAELLEQRAAGPVGARVSPRRGPRGAPSCFGRRLASCFADVAQVEIGAARGDAGEIGRERADRRRDRHVVVVEDDDQALIAGAGVVHRLVGHAGAHGAVADDADDVVRRGHRDRARRPCRGRPRSRSRSGRRRRVVLALGALGEAGEAAALAQRADAVAAAGRGSCADRPGGRRPRSGGRRGVSKT